MKANLSSEDKEYVKSYNIDKYEKPSVAADIAIFTISGNEHEKKIGHSLDNFRKLPQKELKILLVKRGRSPYKDTWAIPGGFCKRGESVYESAARELYEETAVRNAYISLADIYSDDGRDPRGWIMSNTFMALIDEERVNAKAGSDAKEVAWFSVAFTKKCLNQTQKKNENVEKNEYVLTLKSCDENEIVLSGVLIEERHMGMYHEKVTYTIKESNGIAFDHVKIIVRTVQQLRNHVANDMRVIFDLMPARFTLTEIKNAFEIVMDKKIITSNFRRKITSYVKETDELVEGVGHRPARLFERCEETFYCG